MGLYLQMDGVDDNIKIPSLTYTKVVIDSYIEFQSKEVYVISNPNAYSRINADGSWRLNGYTGSGYTYGSRTTATFERATLTAEITIFSHYTNVGFAKGNIYSIKIYNGTTLVAHYDMSTGTVLDQSGNGNHATLTGGTWAYEKDWSKIIVNHEFTAPDGATVPNASTGQVSEKILGNWSIQNNQLQYISGNPALIAWESNQSDVLLSTEYIHDTATPVPGFGFRIVDSNNYWLIRNLSSKFQLYKFSTVGGAQLIKESGTVVLSNGIKYSLQLRAKGDLIEVFHNGTKVLSHNDTYNINATKHGIRQHSGAGQLYDNFIIESLSDKKYYLSMDGVDDFIDSNVDQDLPKDFFVKFRFKGDAGQTNHYGVLSLNNISSSFFQNFIPMRNTTKTLAYWDSLNGWKDTGIVLNYDVWYDIEYRFSDLNKIDFYVDGVFKTSLPLSQAILPTNNFWVGKTNATAQYFKGSLKNIEVQNAFKFDFSVQQGTNIQDISGNGRHATLTGGTWIEAPTYYLSMDGVDDGLTTPMMTTNRIEMEVSSTWIDTSYQYWFKADSDYQTFMTYSTSGWNDRWSSNISVTVDGTAKVSDTELIDRDKRIKVVAIISSAVTDVFRFFHENLSTGFMKGNIYSIEMYNDTTLVAHYDMSTGTVLDQSGNGNHATLTGGTWVQEVATTPPTTVDGIVSMAGLGNVNYSGMKRLSGISSMSSLGDLSANGSSVTAGSLTISANGLGNLSANGRKIVSNSLSMAGTTGMSAIGIRRLAAILGISSTSTMSITGIRRLSSLLGINSSSLMDTTGIRGATGDTSMSSISNLTADGLKTLTGQLTVLMNSLSSMSADGMKKLSGSAIMPSLGSLSPTGRLILGGNTQMDSSSQLSADAVKVITNSIVISGNSTLGIFQAREVIGQALMQSASGLTADAVRRFTSSLSMASTSSISLSGLKSVIGNALMESDSTLSAQAVKILGGEVNLLSNSSLEAMASILSSSSVSLLSGSRMVTSASVVFAGSTTMASISSAVMVGVLKEIPGVELLGLLDDTMELRGIVILEVELRGEN